MHAAVVHADQHDAPLLHVAITHSRPIREYELHTQSSKSDSALPHPILTIASPIISLIGLECV